METGGKVPNLLSLSLSSVLRVIWIVYMVQRSCRARGHRVGGWVGACLQLWLLH